MHRRGQEQRPALIRCCSLSPLRGLTGEVMATLLLSLLSGARFLPKMKPALHMREGRGGAHQHSRFLSASASRRVLRRGVQEPACAHWKCAALRSSPPKAHIWRKPWPSACRMSMSPPAMVTSAIR